MEKAWEILTGDALARLRDLPQESVNCVVTSPPYWGLRDYGIGGQLGLEQSPEEYVARMTEIFRDVRRVLRKDGTLWLNLGDSYISSGGAGWQGKHGDRFNRTLTQRNLLGRTSRAGLPATNLAGIPWRVALALQSDGWILRSDIVWNKRNPIPESVKNRPTKSHEYIFLLVKSRRYFYDGDAIKEPCSQDTHARYARGRSESHKWSDAGEGVGRPQTLAKSLAHMRAPGVNPKAGVNAHGSRQNESFSAAVAGPVEMRNKRTVWTLSNRGYAGAHFATFPPKLIEPCILAGCPRGGLVFDPFTGSGTTAIVALEHGRRFIGIELNPDYVKLATERIDTASAPRLGPSPSSSQAGAGTRGNTQTATEILHRQKIETKEEFPLSVKLSRVGKSFLSTILRKK